ncbi:MAG: deoxyribonuclease IV [bacterium]|nr:deoxyribonuclease IV [bacterium]
MSLCLGAHLFISKGFSKTIEEAYRLELCTFQFFSRNPRSLRNFKRPEKLEIPFKVFFLHSPYLLNLASPEDYIYSNSKQALIEDLLWGDLIGATGIVVHPGSHKGSGRKIGLYKILYALEEIISKVDTTCKIIIENTSGSGTELGSSPEDFEFIIDNLQDKSRIGICLDTCHLFSAGFDLRTKESIKETFDRWFSFIDTSYLMLFHTNDSRGSLGSHLDRHIHIGEGEIGEEGFRNLLSFELFRSKPLIIETPKEPTGSDEKNLNKLRELVS